jgi:hypothetical protein
VEGEREVGLVAQHGLHLERGPNGHEYAGHVERYERRHADEGATGLEAQQQRLACAYVARRQDDRRRLHFL